jgi:hypothetical protein
LDVAMCSSGKLMDVLLVVLLAVLLRRRYIYLGFRPRAMVEMADHRILDKRPSPSNL